MTGTRVAGAFIAAAGLLWLIFSPLLLRMMRDSGQPYGRFGREEDYRSNLRILRVVAAVFLVVGVVYLIAG